MKILVTGGMGFIGSHTVVELLGQGHSVEIVDNLVNSKLDTLDKLKEITGQDIKLHIQDVTDEPAMRRIFREGEFDGLIHFAGLKAVGESVEKPLEYYYNNLLGTILLSKLCLEYGITKFVFSSSATVYGDQPSPLKEEMELGKTTNPYGETKAMSERILMDVNQAESDFSVVLLRYFNPVGAHESGLIGEDPRGIPNNLMPYINKVAAGELEELKIFGDDYDTPDGTGIRDYIHVVDLARGHVAALENMKVGLSIFNLGTGKGTSVLELVNCFIKTNGVELPYIITSRRPGDIATSYADPSKASQELGWQASLTLEDMVRDSWNFEIRAKK